VGRTDLEQWVACSAGHLLSLGIAIILCAFYFPFRCISTFLSVDSGLSRLFDLAIEAPCYQRITKHAVPRPGAAAGRRVAIVERHPVSSFGVAPSARRSLAARAIRDPDIGIARLKVYRAALSSVANGAIKVNAAYWELCKPRETINHGYTNGRQDTASRERQYALHRQLKLIPWHGRKKGRQCAAVTTRG
jgi:hypothetical protein